MPNKIQIGMQRVAKGLFGINFGGPGAGSYDDSRAFVLGLPTGESSDVDQPYAVHAVIATALEILAGDSASIPLEVWLDDADEPEEAHPLLDLFANPSDDMDAHQFGIGTHISRLLTGEGVWYYPDLSIRTPGGPSTVVSKGGIQLLDPRRLTATKKNGEENWTIKKGGEDVPLDMDYLTVFKRFNPYSDLRGLSKVASVMAEIAGDYAAAKWNERFFSEQNGVPSGLLKPSTGSVAGGDMGRDQRREILRTWNQKHGNKKRSVGILPAGWDWQDLGVTQRDMDFRELREYSREQILAAFGVPPFLAGVLDKANYANAREQKAVYWNGTITRFMAGYCSAINSDFLPKLRITGVTVKPCWDNVKALLENLTEKVEVAGKLLLMGYTRRQINNRLELGFDMDDVSDADVQYMPFSLTTVQNIVEPPETPEPPPTTHVEQEEGEEGEEKALKVSLVDGATDKRRGIVWRAIDAQTGDLVRKFDKIMRRHFHNIENEVLGNIKGLKGWLYQQKAKDPPLLFNLSKSKRSLQKMTAPQYRATMKRGGHSLMADVGLDIAFDLNDPVAMARLAELTSLITRVDDTIETALRATMIEGIEAGESVTQLSARISNDFALSMGKSLVIARTETGAAYNSARVISMGQAGIEEHEWLSSRDGDVRDSHLAPLDGERVKVGEPFMNGLEYPNAPGIPEETINCRCATVPVVDGRKN